MLVVFAVAAIVASGPSLEPRDLDPAEVPSPRTAVPARGGPAPWAPLGLVVPAAVAAVALRPERSHETGEYVSIPDDAMGLEPPDDVTVVLVPGHGTDASVFDGLVDLMGLDPDQIEVFDFGWAGGSADPTVSSTWVPADDATHALSGYLHGLGASGRPIYVIGFSKGAVTTAALLAEWDATPSLAVDGVVGAALLDPPMASGVHGWMQSVGRWVGPIPDDGGYDPVECDFWGLECHDSRDHLGEAAGVEVVVFRNPMSGIANFGDDPEGLRVVDVPDRGPHPSHLTLRPADAVARANEAHYAVSHSPVVAACIVAEMNRVGSCEVDPPTYPAAGVVGGGAGSGGGTIGQRVV